jgi:hypothetical protein
VAGNAFVFAAGSGPNWDRTIAKPVELEGLAGVLPDEYQAFLKLKSAGGPLYAWGAPDGAVGTIAGMAEDDVVFGSRRGIVGFGAQVALSLKEPSTELSRVLWGAPDWPYVYFLYRASFAQRPVAEFLVFIGERGRLIQGFRISHKASKLLRDSRSPTEFIAASLSGTTIEPIGPRESEPPPSLPEIPPAKEDLHAEAESYLIRIGETLGLEVWVASNDKSEVVRGYSFRDHTIAALPFQGQPEFHRRIELIDVIWLRGSAIVAAFEVEQSTQVYSGLLRMLDLVTQFPSLSFPLYIVAPDAEKRRVCGEINRPAFKAHRLHEICRFLAYSRLRDAVTDTARLGRHLSPGVIEEYAESCAQGAAPGR